MKRIPDTILIECDLCWKINPDTFIHTCTECGFTICSTCGYYQNFRCINCGCKLSKSY